MEVCRHEAIPVYEKRKKQQTYQDARVSVRDQGWDWNSNPKLKKEKRAIGRARRRGAGVVQEVLGLCSVPSGAETDEPL